MSPPRKAQPEDIAGALHDVSNSLTLLLGWLDALRTAPTEVERSRIVRVVEEQAEVARALCRSALGGETKVQGDVPLERVLHGSVDALEREFSRHDVRAVVKGDPTGLVIAAGVECAQILTNLFLNALAFSPNGSVITIELVRQAEWVFIEVSDEGAGVDPSRASKIFEGQSSREGGAGIGLSYSRKVARAHGGDLTLAPGSKKGARFRLAWPTRVEVPLPPPTVRLQGDLMGLRVVLLEDDEDVAALLKMGLAARGADVAHAKTQKELLSLSEAPADALLLDLSPIEGSLEEVLASARKTSPEAALILTSGSAKGVPEAVTRITRWVRKPFDVREIADVIRQMTRENERS